MREVLDVSLEGVSGVVSVETCSVRDLYQNRPLTLQEGEQIDFGEQDSDLKKRTVFIVSVDLFMTTKIVECNVSGHR